MRDQHIRRGDVFYIREHPTVGHEIRITGARPAVIVSNNALNATSGVVEVCYLTQQNKKRLPTHVDISTEPGRVSTVLCEQVTSVSTSLLGTKIYACNQGEMRAIDHAIRLSLALEGAELVAAIEEELTPENLREEMLDLKETQEAYEELWGEYLTAQAERDTYKRLLDDILQAKGVLR